MHGERTDGSFWVREKYLLSCLPLLLSIRHEISWPYENQASVYVYDQSIRFSDARLNKKKKCDSS